LKEFIVMPVELSRRALIGGGIGFAAGLSAAAHVLVLAADEGTKTALPADGGIAPWDYWLSKSGSGSLRPVAAAILAASPYNTQPWLFRLSGDRIELFADEDRNLGARSIHFAASSTWDWGAPQKMPVWRLHPKE
jgi:hypothetical protein